MPKMQAIMLHSNIKTVSLQIYQYIGCLMRAIR